MMKNREEDRGHQETERNIYETERIENKVPMALQYPCLPDNRAKRVLK